MRILLFIIGLCAAAYAAIAVVFFIMLLVTGDGGVRGAADIASGIVPPILGIVVAHSCFTRVFRKPATVASEPEKLS